MWCWIGKRRPEGLRFRAIGRARALALPLALVLTTGACGSGPAKPKAVVAAPKLTPGLEATDLLPRDLDLVVRIDVARVRAGLGPLAAEAIAKRASEKETDGLVAQAFASADTVWLGLRLFDLDAGDHVIVAEGRVGNVQLLEGVWRETKGATTMEDVRVLDRAPPEVPNQSAGAPEGVLPADSRRNAAPDPPLQRGSTARIVAVRDRVVAFVSPAEIDSISRILREGPDVGHGDPNAEGFMSLDLRGHRLPPGLEKRYPSIGALIAGVTRVRAVVNLTADGVRCDAEIAAQDASMAARIERFLSTIRASLEGTRYAPLLAAAKIERVDAVVHVRVTASASFVVGLLQQESASPNRP